MKRLRAYTDTSSFARLVFIDYFVCINYQMMFLFLLALFSMCLNVAAWVLDVILVDLKEPCSYFNASAFVPFFFFFREWLTNCSLLLQADVGVIAQALWT